MDTKDNLLKACREGDLATVTGLLASGESPNFKSQVPTQTIITYIQYFHSINHPVDHSFHHSARPQSWEIIRSSPPVELEMLKSFGRYSPRTLCCIKKTLYENDRVLFLHVFSSLWVSSTLQLITLAFVYICSKRRRADGVR